MSKSRTLIASVLAFALALPLTVVGIVLAPAAQASGGTIVLTKTVDDPGPYTAGQSMTFTIAATCQSAPCTEATVTDTLPAPLVLDGDDAVTVDAAGGGSYTTTGTDADGGTHVVVEATADQSDGNPGMAPGTTANITVRARVPADATADSNGTVTNTATGTQTAGANTDVTASADVDINITPVIDTTVTKDASTSSVPAVPGQPVSFTIDATNTSNEAVDSLVVSDPAAGGDDPFEYLELTGITSFTPPDGADTVQVDWVDAGGTTHTGTPVSPIPTDPDALLAGIDPLSDVHGLTFTFTGPDGIPIDGEANIVLATQTRDNVADIPDGETETVTNTTSSDVTSDDGDATDTADAAVDIVSEPPTVTTSKSFADDHLLAGDSTTATIRSEVGDRPVTTMVVSDPTDGQPDLADQGLTFGGFTDEAAWPTGADHISIEYTYADGTTSTEASDTRDTFPGPGAGHTNADVTGFTITFTSDTPNGIEPGDFANVPFDVTAQAVDGTEDVTSTNTTTTDVTANDGSTGTDDASDDLVRQPARIDTNVDKVFTPDEIPGVPGASTIVQVPASVCGEEQVTAGSCDAASTVGSDDLIISDPVEPDAGLTDFWNHMNVTSIGPMDIPEGSTLTVNYWDGDSWETLAGPIPAQSGWTYQVGSDPSPDDIQGLQFDFEPDPAGGELPPGFSVLPYVTFQQRAELRDGSGSALPTEETGPNTYTNDVESQVDNPDADESPVTDDDSADITVDPAEGGPGDTIDKGWVDPTTGDVEDTGVTVTALTDDERTARIDWGTHGFPMGQVQISDVPSPATGDAVADTVYDAFDLVRIAPITTATDPLIAFDQVSKVELYSASAGGWVDITSAACANGCDGTFGGYTLSAAEQDDTLSVRLTFVESPTRADRISAPTDPQVGSGVAQSAGNDRPIDLVFRIRQDMRVSGDPVLGNSTANGDQPYNTGTDGLVSNTAQMDGWAPATPTTGDPDYTEDDSADITILDQPVNVTTTKSFEEPTLGLPPEGTAETDYPQDAMTLQASNDTQAKVRTMTIQDPDPGSTSNTFDVMNLNHFISITAPTGADASATEVFLTRGGTEDPAITADAALALGAGDLADVTGVRVVFHGFMDTTTDDTTKAGVVLSMQLRATHRGSGAAVTEADSVDNTSFASATNPEDTATDTANDTVQIETPTYGVNATKTIDPDSRFEGSNNDYTVTIGGKPTGTVRTKTITLTDDDPRFWNAFNFNGFAPTDNVTPIARVKVDALIGVVYALDGDTLVQTCNGITDLAACWVVGDYQNANAPSLPATVTNAQVQGLRYTFDGGADLPNWEHPSNPTATGAFKATQRTNLRYGNDGGTDTPVPSDLSTNTIAPGETDLGVTTNDQQVHAVGSWVNDGTPWTADADAEDSTLLKHLTNQVEVTKTPGNGNESPTDESPNSPIPYQFVVTNNGDWPQTGVTIVDTLPTDVGGPSLVPASGDLPADGQCSAPDPDFTVQLQPAGGDAAPLEGASAQYCMNLQGAPEITVTLPDGFVLQPGDAIVVDTPLVYRGGADPVAPGSNVVNSVTVSDDRVYDTCDSTHNSTVDNPQTTEVDSCTADTTTQPRALTPLRVTKAVKGVGAGDPAVSEGDPNYDDLGVRDVSTAASASTCEDPTVPNYAGDVIYYGEKCVPITRPGGVERWQVRLVNAGNIPAHIVAGIDVLPTPGDTGVVVPTARDSEFRPRLIGNFSYDGEAVTDSTPMKLYYTNDTLDEACNTADILNSTTTGGIDPSDPCYGDITSRTWTEITTDTPESELASATALKAVLTYNAANEGLAPGDNLALTFDTRTPANAPQTTVGQDPIAWNSVAEGSQGVFVNPNEPTDVTYPVSLVTEPPKVGIAMATGSIKLTKDVVTPPDSNFPLPTSYPVQLFCTSVGAVDQPIPVPVTILDQNGDDQSVVDVPADDTITVNDRSDPGDNQWSNVTIPWGANCYAQEQPTPQGSTVTYDPTSPLLPARSGSVEALQDYSSRTDIAHPISTSPDTIKGATITNTYENGGFTVSKAVDNGGAVDQDGNPIAYTRDYTFTASCLFNGTEVVPAADQTFTLNDGDSKTFEGLPAGSDCTVTETDDGGAASTTTTTTTGGTAGDPTDGTTSTFTITPDTDQTDPTTVTNDVAVNNTYTVGSVEVTKAVTGDGADDWGQGPFVVHMVCTLDGTDPTPVYEADHTLTPPDDLTWTVDNLPTGASCSVTEPTSAGANTVAFDPSSPVVVGDTPDTPTPVTVTNSFTEGSVSVTKNIAGLTGTALAQAEDHTYTFSLECTREVDGLEQGVTIPGDNPIEVTPSVDPTGTWDDLPTGATCTVTELFPDDPANPPTASYDPSTVTVGDGTTVNVDVTNTFETAPLSVEKVVDGDAADAGATSYPVTADCTFEGAELSIDPDNPDAAPGPYSFDVVPGTPSTTAPLPIGTTCTVTEDDNQGATSTTVSNDGDQTIVSLAGDADPDADTVTITNTYDDTGFNVSKAVDNGDAVDQDGNDIAYTGDYTFTASCLLNGNQQVDPQDRTFTIADGETYPIDGIAVNSVCTVNETGAQDAASTTMVVTQDGTAADGTTGTSSGEFTLDAGGADINAVAVTNHYTVGSVQVTKDVTGDGADDWGQGPFTVHMVCTLDGTSPSPVYEADHTLTPPGDLTWTVDNLPTGASCAVTEPKAGNGGANTTTIDPSPVTVGDSTTDDPAVVTVTNTFTEGSVSVHKIIGGLDNPSTEYTEAANASYTFSLECTRVVNGETVDVPIPGDNPIEVVPADGVDGTWTGLPTGATCAVTEQFPEGQDTPPLVVTLPRTVTVGVGDSTTLVRTLNGFRVAPLTIEKVVDGDAAAAAPTTYPVSVECFYGTGANRVALPVENADDNPGPVQEEIGPDQPFTTIGLPIGSQCSVTEVDNGGATSTTITGSNVSDATDDSGTATIVPTTGPNAEPDGDTVTITNTFDATGFTVTKTVDNGGAKNQNGDPVHYTGPYSFAASCLFNGTEQLDPADQKFTVTDGATHTVTDAPVGSICDVKETDSQGAPSTSVVVTQNGTAGDTTDGTDSGVFTLRAGGAAVNAVGVTNGYTVGSVKITKKITGAGAATRGSGPFEVKLVCTLDGTSPSPVYSGTHEVSKGHLTWTVDNLPTGASCNVTETDNGGADMTTITPGAFVVGDGTTAQITVTNAFDPVPPPPSPSSTEASGSNLPTTGFPAERLALIVAGLLGLGILTIGAALWARRRE